MSTVEQGLREHELLEDAETNRDIAIYDIVDELKEKLAQTMARTLCLRDEDENIHEELALDLSAYHCDYLEIFSFLSKRDGESFLLPILLDNFSQRSELEIATDIADQVNFDEAATAEYERKVEEAKTNAAEDTAREMEDSYRD